MVIKITLCFSICLLLSAASSFAAQSKSERSAEAQQSAAEDEAARLKNPEAMYSDYNGKVALFTKDQKDDDGESGVIGTFTTDKSTYLIKTDSSKVLKELTPLDGKMCTVTAKIRNEGKYIVIQKLVLNGAEYIFKKRRGGVGM